jgi:hypothetical protein
MMELGFTTAEDVRRYGIPSMSSELNNDSFQQCLERSRPGNCQLILLQKPVMITLDTWLLDQPDDRNGVLHL